MKWIKCSDEKPNGSYYYVIYYDIENSEAVFYKKELIDLAYADEEGYWYFADDTPIVFDDEKLVIKYWIPVPDLPNDD